MNGSYLGGVGSYEQSIIWEYLHRQKRFGYTMQEQNNQQEDY